MSILLLKFKLFYNKHKSLFESLHFSKIDFIDQIELFYGGSDGVKNKDEFNRRKKDLQVKERENCFNLLFGKDNDCNSKLIEKVNVIKEIISVLGFDLNDLDKIIVKDIFYKNKDKLLTDSQFSRNYESVRGLFGRTKGVLNSSLSGNYLINMINGYLNESCMVLFCKNKVVWDKVNYKPTRLSKFQLRIMD